jgi:hypothetical protein
MYKTDYMYKLTLPNARDSIGTNFTNKFKIGVYTSMEFNNELKLLLNNKIQLTCQLALKEPEFVFKSLFMISISVSNITKI